MDQTVINKLPDFYRRRDTAPSHEWTYSAFGYTVHFAGNDPILLDAARLSAARYSRSDPISDAPPMRLTVAIDPQADPIDVPPNLPAHLKYVGVDDWITVTAQPWVRSFAHLDRREGIAFVSRPFAQERRFLSRYILDCFTMNTLLRYGLGQLHASCLVRDPTERGAEGRQVVVLAGRHNIGKSTTALRLVRAGYRLVTDAMTFIRLRDGRLELMGWPAGEVKLRPDTLELFPELKGRGEATLVRDDAKYLLDLRREMPEALIDEVVTPARMVVCLVQRDGGADTRVELIGRDEARQHLLPDGLFFDSPRVVQRSFAVIDALLDRAGCYRLTLGTGAEGIVRAVDGLWG